MLSKAAKSSLAAGVILLTALLRTQLACAAEVRVLSAGAVEGGSRAAFVRSLLDHALRQLASPAAQAMFRAAGIDPSE